MHMNTLTRILPVSVLAAGMLVASMSAQADWQLNNQQSSLNLLSVKKVHIAEVFHITRLAGQLSDNGALSVQLDLDSIETNIGIRNDRMREHLFETSKFKTATVISQLPAEVMQTVKNGGFVSTEIDATLSFHGLEKPLKVKVSLMSDGKQILASSSQPVVLSAETFGLTAGIDKLKSLAGLDNIGYTVPVSFSLLLEQ